MTMTNENRAATHADKIQELSTLFSSEQFSEVEKLALKLIRENPSDEHAQYFLAQAMSRQGRADEAVELMKSLIVSNPMQPAFHNDYGAMLASINRWPEAEASYRMAIVLNPNTKGAYLNLAYALFKQDRPEEGLAAFNRALETDAETQEMLLHAALVFEEMKKHPETLSVFIEKGEKTAATCFFLGNLMQEQGNLEMTRAYYRQAIELKPDFIDAYNNLGLSLLDEGQTDAAQQIFEQAIEAVNASGTTASLSAIYCNLGICMVTRSDIPAALEYFKLALATGSNSAVLLSNLGLAYYQIFMLDEAESLFRQALLVDPDCREAQLNLGILLLLQGKFGEGWPLYEQRWHTAKLMDQKKRFTQPEWQGEPLATKGLLIYAEQGFGDNLQFIRYLGVLREMYPTARLYYASQSPLMRLFTEYAAACQVQILPMNINATLCFDYHAGLLSLPRILGTTLENIPAQSPYLAPPLNLFQHWQNKVAEISSGNTTRKIGLVWKSGEIFRFHKTRTMHLEQLRPLLQIPGIDWFSLQKGPGVEQIADTGLSGTIINLMDEVTDFADTAAIIAHLDLVISVDTSVAHLAGAMGKPVWLLDRFNTDWRWLLNRTDSPWYPSMRIFRQPALGDWEPVVNEAQKALTTWMTQPLAPSPLQSDIPSMISRELKLNLGCGNRKLDGFINVDQSETCHPDEVFNLETFPWPWEDNSVSEIKLIHVLEHLGQQSNVFLSIMKEMHRVCRDGAMIEIVVPHPRHDDFLSDPTHVRAITTATLGLFNQRLNHEWEKMGAPNTPLGIICGVDFEMEVFHQILMPQWQEKKNISEEELNFAIVHFNNVVQSLHFVLRAHKNRFPAPPAEQSTLTATMEKQAHDHFANGNFEEAASLYRHMLSQTPARYDIECMLGLAYQNMQAFKEAKAHYEHALSIAPPSLELYYNLGVVYMRLADHQQAITYFEKALKMLPGSIEILISLAEVKRANKDIQGALEYYEKIFTINPKSAPAYQSMGNTFADFGYEADAELAYRTALSFDPGLITALNGLAIILIRTGRHTDAIEILNQIHEAQPKEAGILRNLAMAHAASGDFISAENYCKQALVINPKDPDIHFMLGTNYLMTGRLQEGWKALEYRWQSEDQRHAVRPIHSTLKRWHGETVNQKIDSLIIYAEQGFGDCIQFARFTEQAAKLFKRVLLHTRPALLSLFTRSFGKYAEVVSQIDDESDYTHYCPQMSLPLAFATTLENIPVKMPYLTVNPALVSRWRERLRTEKRYKVGFAWTTGKHPMHKKSFEIALEELAPLFALSNICWVSLNKDEPNAAQKDFLVAAGIIDWTKELASFDDTAALMSNLDLIISVDTAVAHLAGALGQPVWLLNRAESEWRWMRDRTDSPWYPSMRIFRQQTPRQWKTVIEDVQNALQQLPAAN